MPRVILHTAWEKRPHARFILEKGFVLEDFLTKRLGQNPFQGSQPDYDLLEHHYGIFCSGDRAPWREVLLSATAIDVCFEGFVLHGRRIDSTSIANMRRDTRAGEQATDIFKRGTEVAVNGVLLSNDQNKILIGVRSGKVMTGTHGLVPAGGVAYRDSENPIYDGLLEEAKEELGILPKDIASCRLFCYISQTKETGAPNDLFGYEVISIRELGELIEIHTQARASYDQWRNEGKSEHHARILLVENGFPADAGEHTLLYTLENSPDAIIYFMTEKAHHDQLTQSLYGVLQLYLLVRFGEQEYKKCFGHDYLRNRIDSSSLRFFE